MAATFRSFVVEHESPLLRTAYLLTGNRDDADELLTTALAGTHRRWRRVSAADPVATVRRTMVRDLLRKRPTARPAAPAWAPDDADAEPPSGTAEELRQALLGLPPRTRAALVLRLHDGLTEAATAEVLGCAPDEVGTLTGEGTAVLRARGVAGLPAPPRTERRTAGADGDRPASTTDDVIYRRPR